jgi:hypothetical protein
MDTLSAVALTDETARAIFDMFVDNINDVNLLRSGFFHAVKECSGDVHRIAFVTLGTAVQNKYFHSVFSPSAYQFFCLYFYYKSVRKSRQSTLRRVDNFNVFSVQIRGIGGIPQQAMRGVVTGFRGNELPCLLRWIFAPLGNLCIRAIRLGIFAHLWFKE